MERETKSPGQYNQSAVVGRIEAQSPHWPEHQLEAYFKDNPGSYAANVLLLMGLSARVGAIAYITGEDNSLIMGEPSQHSYARLLKRVHQHAADRLRGQAKSGLESFLYDSLSDVLSYQDERAMADYLAHAADSKNKIIAGTPLTPSERSQLMFFDIQVRRASNKLFYATVDDLVRSDALPPDGLFHPEILLYFSEPSYWEPKRGTNWHDDLESVRRDEQFLGWMERVHTQTKAIVATNRDSG